MPVERRKIVQRPKARRMAGRPVEPSWRLIVPCPNWKEPLPLTADTIETLAVVAKRLNLIYLRDDVQHKIYLGHPPECELTQHHCVLYPNGRAFPCPRLPTHQALRYQTTGSPRAARLIAVDRHDALSDHFCAGEFFPADGQCIYIRILPQLVSLLEVLRKRLGGKPVHVISGYRTPGYNRDIGGSLHSPHVDGLACDICVPHVPLLHLWEVADELVADHGGVGYCPERNFVHIDLRGTRVRWARR